LDKTISELSAHTSYTDRKPIVLMNAGIMTEENAKVQKINGHDYIAVSRTKLKDYNKISGREKNITL